MSSKSTASRSEPAYTVIGVYESGPSKRYLRFGEIFYTHNGPGAAEDLARQWARAQQPEGDPDDIIIAAVIAGEISCVDASLGGASERVGGRHRMISDQTALDRMAELLSRPGEWNGGDVCEALYVAVLQTGREVKLA